MEVFVKLLPHLGYYLGPTFKIIPNIGLSVPDIFTKEQLLNGVYVDIPNSATSIKIKSLGEQCQNEITYPIGIPTTTTTTTVGPSTTTSTSSTSTSTSTSTSSTSTSTTSTSTSSTTSTTTLPPCKCYKITNTSTTATVLGNYSQCDGLGTIIVLPLSSIYICAYENTIVYTANGGVATQQVRTNLDPDYASCPCSGITTSTSTSTSTSTTSTSTSTSTTSTTTAPLPFQWTGPSVGLDLESALIAYGCNYSNTYYTELDLDDPAIISNNLYTNSALTNVASSLNDYITLTNGTNLYLVELVGGLITNVIDLGNCNSPWIIITIEKLNICVPGPGSDINVLLAKYEVDKNATTNNLLISGNYIKYNGDVCTSPSGGLNPLTTYNVPAGSPVGFSYTTPGGMTSGVGIESVKITSLVVEGNTITNPIQVITVGGNKYVVFSPIGECLDLPSDVTCP